MIAHCWLHGIKCEEKGCNARGVDLVACYLHPYDVGNEKPDQWYCFEHAAQNGYCKSCGVFWGGVDSFEFGEYPGFCDLCADELRANDWEPDEDDYWIDPRLDYECEE